MNAVTKVEGNALALSEPELMNILRNSLYPGARDDSIRLVLGYCKAAGLDPLQKPVHIVPMYDRSIQGMRDVVMPGIGLYRTQASRSGEYAGVSEPDFGPDVTEMVGEVQMTYPAWCRVSVMRRLPTGEVVAFTAKEFWKENYAVRGGKDKSVAPNAMWFKRPYGQIAKCAEAQALRKAFPEIGSQPVAEEMEGKAMQHDTEAIEVKTPVVLLTKDRTEELTARFETVASVDEFNALYLSLSKDERGAMKMAKEAAKARLSEAA